MMIGSFRAFAGRLTSGTKLLLIMTLALLPLGIIALLASIQSAHTKRVQHQADAMVVASAEARQIELMVVRAANIVRFAAVQAQAGTSRCRQIDADTRELLRTGGSIGFFAADGSFRCGTRDLADLKLPRPRDSSRIDLTILPDRQSIRFAVAAEDGSFGVGELPMPMLKAALGVGYGTEGIALRQKTLQLQLTPPLHHTPFQQRITVGAPIADGQVELLATSVASSISAIEVLVVLLPLVMWFAATIIAWTVINELLLRPLKQLQRSVDQVGEEGGTLVIPPLRTPARELRELGDAFAIAADQIASRETALQEGLAHQVRLTREVHHRVKNNLQVVASLINLHARGASGDVAAAYGSIQRRVDALAVVHRNHYAELEKNNGVSLRSLLAELTSNLRASAPTSQQDVFITLDIPPANITQDVAVPVAFLVTEIVELVMECQPKRSTVTISLQPIEGQNKATLIIGAPMLLSTECGDHPSRAQFERIIAGLARQLRSSLTFDESDGCYRIEIAILPPGGTTASVRFEP